MIAAPAVMGMMVSMASAAVNVGGYISTFWTLLCHKLLPAGSLPFESEILVTAGIACLVTVLTLFKDLRPKEDR